MWWAYMAGTLLTASIGDVPWARYLRVAFPFALCGLTLSVVRGWMEEGLDPERLLFPLLTAGVVSVVWTFAHSMWSTGIPLAFQRYRILSPAVPFLIGYAGFLSLKEKRPAWNELIAVGAAFCAALLATTRYVILSAACAAAGAVVWSRSMSGREILDRFRTSAFRMSAALMMGAAVAWTLWPGFVNGWMGRFKLAGPGGDVTAVLRIAEYSGQMKFLFRHPKALMAGAGLGREFTLDPAWMKDVPTQMYRETDGWAFGHGIWVYSLFTGGIFFGFVIPILFIAVLWVGLGKSFRGESPSAALGFLVLLSYFGMSFVTHPFVYRFSAVIIGTAAGLCLWAPGRGPGAARGPL